MSEIVSYILVAVTVWLACAGSFAGRAVRELDVSIDEPEFAAIFIIGLLFGPIAVILQHFYLMAIKAEHDDEDT